MSERKTDEIKFRVRPSDKARWQSAAEAEGISLSQYLENAANNAVWDAQNRTLYGTPSSLLEFIATNCQATGELTTETLKQAHDAVLELVPAPFTGTPTPAQDLLDDDALAVVADEAAGAGADADDVVAVVEARTPEHVERTTMFADGSSVEVDERPDWMFRG